MVWNTATVTSGGFVDDDDACQVVFFDDVGIVKTATGLSADGSVEPGDTFDYVLTVTNYGDREATNVRVTDDDLNDRLEITGLPVASGARVGSRPGLRRQRRRSDDRLAGSRAGRRRSPSR